MDEEIVKKPLITLLCECGGRDFIHIPNPIREITVECTNCHRQYLVYGDKLKQYAKPQ